MNLYGEFNSTEIRARRKNLRPIKAFNTKSLTDVPNKLHDCSKSKPWTLTKFNFNLNYEQSSRNRGNLKVQFSDTGCGIAQEHIPQLFQMFTQAHRSVSNMHGGTGLGLWICKQLCQKMGGDIKLYSQLGRGTSFVFYVPINNDEMLSPSHVRSNPLQDRLNVLVVDDYAHNRELHKLLVEKEGGQAILASDGKEAVEKFQAREEGYFSFIMMDVRMSDVDGFTAAKMIREWEREQKRENKVDIYFVSGEYFDEEEMIAAFRAAGGTSNVSGIRCLRKPIELESIRMAIARYSNSE